MPSYRLYHEGLRTRMLSSIMSRNQRIGKWGEDAAVTYLEGRGYEIVARNLHTPHGEIDILAKHGDFWVFVEVKARTSTFLGPPEISVGPRKQAHMLASAEYYAQRNPMEHWRIDVVAVEKRDGTAQITHFENAVTQA